MTQNNETRPDMPTVPSEARDRVYTKNGTVSDKKVCDIETCDNCGRLVCPMRGSPGIIVCNNFVSHDIMQRTLRDTPPNEYLIRGCRQ